MNDLQTLSPYRTAAAAEESVLSDPLQSRNTAHTAIGISGFASVQPSMRAAPFIPVWYRAWEAKLHSMALKATRQKHLRIARFGASGSEDLSMANVQPMFDALAEAAGAAFEGVATGAPKSGDRTRRALLFLDHWGRNCFMESLSALRNAFNLDVIPEFILRQHKIGGFSCKLRGESHAFLHALQIARDLIVGNVADTVLIGGLFRSYPVFAFSSAAEEIKQERTWIGRTKRDDVPWVERACFCVATRHFSEQDGSAGAPVQLIGQRYLRLPSDRDRAAATLRESWLELAGDARVLIYGGMRPSLALEKIETKAASGLADAVYENISQRFGDSGCLNGQLALQRFQQTKMDLRGEGPVCGVISTTHADGTTSVMYCV